MRDDEAFRVLGLSPSATREEIRAAYRRLVKAWHPDRHGTNPERRAIAEETLRRVIDAYRSVRNGVVPPEPERRPPPPPAPNSAMFSVDPTAAPAFRASRQTFRPSGAEERLRRRQIARKWLARIAMIAVVAASSRWWFPTIWIVRVYAGLIDVAALPRLREPLESGATLADRVACYSENAQAYETCMGLRYYGMDPRPRKRPGLLQFALCAKLQQTYSEAAYSKCVAELQQVGRK